MALSQQQLLAALLQSQPQPQEQQQQEEPMKAPKTKIPSGSLPIFKAPRGRLAEAVEKIDKTFDAASLLGWFFHRIKPSLSPTDLRVGYWEDLYDAMLTATERVKAID